MHNQDPNNYWEQLERLEKLIRASELKAGVLFSFHSLILGLLADRIQNFKSYFVDSQLLMILAGIWLVLVLTSIFYCFKCFRPQMEFKYNKNVFFFGDAVSKFGNTEDYTKQLMKVCGNKDELFQQLSEQIHAESKIITGKFQSVHNSIKFFGLSFLMLIIMLFIILAKV
ncbi:Pycsar system effector family protein [Geojedonia litorea]|uniref:Pycsar system effector family protein n=1 Tax=Geojedonia litorea TaxID=1268269 RepID=A0ABV9N5Q0_9FLAO